MPEENEKPVENEQRRDSESSSGGTADSRFNDGVRAILSGIVLVGFVATLAVVVYLQYDVGKYGESIEGVPTIESVGSIYAGVTGVILGYYFGKS